MSPETRAKIKASVSPPWDDLREQRVLGRVLEERRRGARAPSRRGPIVAVAAAAFVAAAAVIVLVARHHGAPDASRPAPIASAIPSPSSSPATPHDAPEQSMTLADGSQAFLVRDAAVQIEEQRVDRVRIVQRRGEVRYETKADAPADLTVLAGGATIRARGTIFAVAIGESALDVRVRSGRVVIDDGTRTRDLVEGESLHLPLRPDSGGRETAGAAEPEDPRDPSAASRAQSAAALQTQADEARLAGRNADAATALQRLVALHPRDPRVPGALFSLGRVERARGRHDASARAFERCVAAAPRGPLAGDALAEAAVSWSGAGSADAARADATKYLARYPDGPSAARMRAILAP